jgi:hypothetical protein
MRRTLKRAFTVYIIDMESDLQIMKLRGLTDDIDEACGDREADRWLRTERLGRQGPRSWGTIPACHLTSILEANRRGKLLCLLGLALSETTARDIEASTLANKAAPGSMKLVHSSIFILSDEPKAMAG